MDVQKEIELRVRMEIGELRVQFIAAQVKFEEASARIQTLEEKIKMFERKEKVSTGSPPQPESVPPLEQQPPQPAP